MLEWGPIVKGRYCGGTCLWFKIKKKSRPNKQWIEEISLYRPYVRVLRFSRLPIYVTWELHTLIRDNWNTDNKIIKCYHFYLSFYFGSCYIDFKIYIMNYKMPHDTLSFSSLKHNQPFFFFFTSCYVIHYLHFVRTSSKILLFHRGGDEGGSIDQAHLTFYKECSNPIQFLFFPNSHLDCI